MVRYMAKKKKVNYIVFVYNFWAEKPEKIMHLIYTNNYGNFLMEISQIIKDIADGKLSSLFLFFPKLNFIQNVSTVCTVSSI